MLWRCAPTDAGALPASAVIRQSAALCVVVVERDARWRLFVCVRREASSKGDLSIQKQQLRFGVVQHC